MLHVSHKSTIRKLKFPVILLETILLYNKIQFETHVEFFYYYYFTTCHNNIHTWHTYTLSYKIYKEKSQVKLHTKNYILKYDFKRMSLPEAHPSYFNIFHKKFEI